MPRFIFFNSHNLFQMRKLSLRKLIQRAQNLTTDRTSVWTQVSLSKCLCPEFLVVLCEVVRSVRENSGSFSGETPSCLFFLNTSIRDIMKCEPQAWWVLEGRWKNKSKYHIYYMRDGQLWQWEIGLNGGIEFRCGSNYDWWIPGDQCSRGLNFFNF